MYSAKDYFKLDPWAAVISVINAKYFLELQPGSTKLVSMESQGGTRTKVVIDTNYSTSDQNTAPEPVLNTYYYDRLDLASFFRVTGTKTLTGFSLPVTSDAVRKYIAEHNQMKLTVDEFSPQSFTDYNTVYVLKAGHTSLVFTGELNILFSNTLQKDLATLGTVVELPSTSRYGDGLNGDTIAAKYYVSMYDFTKYREHLVSLTADVPYPDGPKLAAQMQAITKKPWTCVAGAKAHNLCYSLFNGVPKIKVVYNGRVLPRFTTRKDKLNVLVLQLSVDNCPDVSGQLRLHYD